MSGVVLRCTTCGTTQNHAGECETCGEGTVRYYCGNHSPGLWMDAPVCAVCGAKFGERPPEPTRAILPSSPAPRASETGRPAGTTRPYTPPRAEPRTPIDPEPEPEHFPAPPSLTELLDHLARERTARPFMAEEPPRERRGAAHGAVRAVGCLLKIVIFVILLIVFSLGGCFLRLGGAGM